MAQSNGHVRSWQEADSFLGTKQERPLAHNTRIRRRDDNCIVIRLHDTDIVTYFPRELMDPPCTVLHSGGWMTSTTKERINQYMPEGFSLWQERGQWYVSRHANNWDTGASYPWAEGITIDSTGHVWNAGARSEVEERKRLQRRIGAYVHAYAAALIAGNVPAPSGADCWICMTMPDNQDTDHILSHLEESYFVPTLLVKALDMYPLCPFARNELAGIWSGSAEYQHSRFGDDILKRDVTSTLRRYLRHCLAIAS